MRRTVLATALILALAGVRAGAQPIGRLDNLHNESTIGESERNEIRAWLDPLVRDLVATTDPEQRRMIRARSAIVSEGRGQADWSRAFVDAFAEEAVKALAGALQRAVSQEAHVNIIMAVADMERVQGVPLLVRALSDDPYPAARYLAARGLDRVAAKVVEAVEPRVEQEIAKGITGALAQTDEALTFMHLVRALGRFDHDQAHDYLASAAARAARLFDAGDPVGCQVFMAAVEGLERAFTAEIRPDAKQRILMAYAMLAAWIMPPTADQNLMPALNASLERILGEGVGFAIGQSAEMQKLALMEWVEKLVREKRIPGRPPLPPTLAKLEP